MKILAIILATLTQKPRQKVIAGVDFEWSKDSWVHNFFRVYELLFWRRAGIKAEAASTLAFKDGKIYELHVCYSWEASFAFFETYMRSLSRFKIRIPALIWIPALVTPNGFTFQSSPYLFAVAFDAESNSGGSNWPGSASSTLTLAHTCTGSNRIIMPGLYDYLSNSTTGVTYNSVATTKITSITGTADAGTQDISLWRLVAPATGANNIVATYTLSTVYNSCSGMSYTGVNQTSPIDSFATGQSGGSGSSPDTQVTVATTVVGSGCWLVGFAATRGATPIAGGTGTTVRGQNNTSGSAGGDSNGTVSTGSQSLQWTSGSGAWPGAVVVSLAPVASAVVANPAFLLKFLN